MVAAWDASNSPDLFATRSIPIATPKVKPIINHACHDLTRVTPTTAYSFFKVLRVRDINVSILFWSIILINFFVNYFVNFSSGLIKS